MSSSDRVEPAVPTFIYGAGQFGHVAASMLEALPGRPIGGFVDDDEAWHGKRFHGYECIGGFEELARRSSSSELAVVVAIGRNDVRLRVAQRLEDLGVGFACVVHRSVDLPPGVKLGRGCIISSGAVLNTNPSIGDHVFIGPGAIVGHDVAVGDGALISAGAVVGARVEVARGAMVGAGATVMPPAWGASQRLTVGENAIVGAGAVAVRSVRPRSVVFGNPAKHIRFND